MLFWNWVEFSAKFLGVCALTTNISREWKIVPSGMFPLSRSLASSRMNSKAVLKTYTSLLYLSFSCPAPVPPAPSLLVPPLHADILTLLHIRQN